MIERPTGMDADLIIETRWPPFDETALGVEAHRHRHNAAAAAGDTHTELAAAHARIVSEDKGMAANRAVQVIAGRAAAAKFAQDRHIGCADSIEMFVSAVIAGKEAMIAAVETFQRQWAQAGELSKRNNWYQDEYNAHRVKLINEGRAEVAFAANAVNVAYETMIAAVGEHV